MTPTHYQTGNTDKNCFKQNWRYIKKGDFILTIKAMESFIFILFLSLLVDLFIVMYFSSKEGARWMRERQRVRREKFSVEENRSHFFIQPYDGYLHVLFLPCELLRNLKRGP